MTAFDEFAPGQHVRIFADIRGTLASVIPTDDPQVAIVEVIWHGPHGVATLPVLLDHPYPLRGASSLHHDHTYCPATERAWTLPHLLDDQGACARTGCGYTEQPDDDEPPF